MDDQQQEPIQYVAYPRERDNFEAPPPGYIYIPGGTHSVVISAMLSILIAGGGQLFNRQIGKGLVFIALNLLTCGIASLVLWPISIIDAALIASKLRKGQLVRIWEFF